jgi:hypothetical protein
MSNKNQCLYMREQLNKCLENNVLSIKLFKDYKEKCLKYNYEITTHRKSTEITNNIKL